MATRSAPSCSDSENWLSTEPLTLPLDAYVVVPGLEASKRWISVSRRAAASGFPATPGTQRWLAT